MKTDRRTVLGWLEALPLGVIVLLAVVLWRPASDPPPSKEQELKIANLASLLGSSSTSARDIEQRLQSFGPFPPDPRASRLLAEALISCETTGLDESRRRQLARHLFGIAVIGDDRATAIPAALIGIQQTLTGAGSSCNPLAMDRVVSAARAVAVTDPNSRRDWW